MHRTPSPCFRSSALAKREPERCARARRVLLCSGLLVCALAHAAAPEPPAAGRGYGRFVRTIEGLQGVAATLALDDGSVVVALGPGGVAKILPEGSRSTLVPWWPAGPVGNAVALCLLPDGAIMVADDARGQLIRVAPDGTRSAEIPLLADGITARPVGVAALGARIAVADGALPRVLVLDSAGKLESIWTVPPPSTPGVPAAPPLLAGMAAGGGHLFLSDAANHRIVRLDPATGAVTATWGDRGAFPGMFESPAQLAWDGSALLVTDTLNHRVVRFDASGKPLDQWGMHAVRPREGQGKIHYPSGTSVSPDGVIAVVSEPFERRVQLFTEELPPDPAKPRLTALPANEGLASHFSSEVAIDGQTLVVYEPESASALVFDMRNEPPIHVTTIGGPGMRAGLFGQVSTQLVDEAANRVYFADPIRGVISVFALRRDGTPPHFDPFMARLVAEVPLGDAAAFAASHAGGPARLWPLDLRRSSSGGFVMLDGFGPRIVEFDASLRPISAWGGWTGEGRLIAPTQCAVTAGDEVLVVDRAERAVKRYGLHDGLFRGAWKMAEAKRPFGIATIRDPGGGGEQRYAITDSAGDSIMIYDATAGKVVERMGRNGGKSGELWEAGAVEFAPSQGRLYVSDHGNHRLQSFRPDGQWESTFGLGRTEVRPRAPQSAPGGAEAGGASAPPAAPAAPALADTRAQFVAPVRGDDGWSSVRSADGTYDVRYRFLPDPLPMRDPFAMEVTVTNRTTGAPAACTLRVDAAMPQHGHGMNLVPTIERGVDGTWRVDHMLFHMPGYWELYFDITERGRVERAQSEATLE